MLRFYDLSLLVTRKYWLATLHLDWPAVLIVHGFKHGAILRGRLNRDITKAGHYYPYIVILAEIPLLTATSTIFLGNALFHGNCDIGYCFRGAIKALPRLLSAAIMKPLLMLSPAHMCEVFLLETTKRRTRLETWQPPHVRLATGLFSANSD